MSAPSGVGSPGILSRLKLDGVVAEQLLDVDAPSFIPGVGFIRASAHTPTDSAPAAAAPAAAASAAAASAKAASAAALAPTADEGRPNPTATAVPRAVPLAPTARSFTPTVVAAAPARGSHGLCFGHGVGPLALSEQGQALREITTSPVTAWPASLAPWPPPLPPARAGAVPEWDDDDGDEEILWSGGMG
jgi:hypothetical protein